MTLKSFTAYSGPKILRLLFLTIVVGFFWFMVEAGFVYIMQGFLTSLGLTPRSATFLPSWYPSTLVYSLGVFFVFALFRSVLQIARTYLFIKTAQEFVFDRRKALLDLGLDLAGKVTFKELNSYFTEMVVNASTTYTYLAQLCTSVIAAVCMAGFGFYIAPKEMLIGIGILSIVYPALKVIYQKIEVYGRNVSTSWKHTNETMIEGLKNNFLLKIYGMVDFEKKQGAKSLADIRTNYDAYSFMLALSGALPFMLGCFAICGVAYISLTYIGTSGSVLISFIYIFVRLSQLGSEASSLYSSLSLSVPFLKQLFAWEEEQKPKAQEALAVPTKELAEKIHSLEVHHLGLRYVDRFLFRNLNLRLQLGDLLVIKGRSGVGKSSLLNILIGYTKSSEGEITINDKVKVFESAVSFYDQIAYAGPEPYLVAGTVRFNLLYGNKLSLSDTEIWKALDAACISEEVRGFPKGLDSYLGDVAAISTGQKQRLALARAFLRKPQILVLDEATANLDRGTEEMVVNMIKSLQKEMMVIVVSHKDSFDAISSRIIDLGNETYGERTISV